MSSFPFPLNPLRPPQSPDVSPSSRVDGNSAHVSANANAYLPPDDLRLPDANVLFSPITISLSDIDSLPHNTVFRRLIRDIHTRQYDLRATAVRATDMAALSEVRGRIEELDRLLSTLRSYLTGQSDAHASDLRDGEDGDFEEVRMTTEV